MSHTMDNPPGVTLPSYVKASVAVMRDVAIIYFLTFLGGFIVGVATGGPEHDPRRYMLALRVSDFSHSTLGFAIVGCLSPVARWRHIGMVAFAYWLVSYLSVLFFGITASSWLKSVIGLIAAAAIGGAASYIFRRTDHQRNYQLAPADVP